MRRARRAATASAWDADATTERSVQLGGRPHHHGVAGTSDVLVARQPIFDRRQHVAGYELLFRGAPAGELTSVDEAERRTGTVVMNLFTDIGIERIVGNVPAWINVSREFVLSGLIDSLPPELVVLEFLEDQLIDGEVLEAIERLKHAGYRIALDDFIYSAGTDPLIDLADLVKLDILQFSEPELRDEVRRLKERSITLLAEKVENRAELDRCREEPFALFQGYFFCRPELVRGRRLDAQRTTLLKLLAALHQDDVQIATLERMIGRDVGLSYRLLRYLNSAYFGLGDVRSIGQALALLGIENVKSWAILSAYGVIDDKPAELAVTALVRARFCELAAAQVPAANSREMFTLGLFSVIDALLDMPIDEVLDAVPLPTDMRAALITHEGTAGTLLESVAAIEVGDFDRARIHLRNPGKIYIASLEWAADTSGALAA